MVAVKSLLISFLFFNATNSTVAQAAENILHLHYHIQCENADNREFPGIVGQIKTSSDLLRFTLFKYNQDTEIALGNNTITDFKFEWKPSTGCKLQDLKPEVILATDSDKFGALALEHSPLVFARADQIEHFDRDVPLAMTYTVITSASGVKIRYTEFFSNESVSGLFSTTKEESMLRWGRRTDIEWVYEVEFSNDDQVLARHYQGGLLFGIGHSTQSFSGEFLTGTQHPILYNIATHNIFSDHKMWFTLASDEVAFHLVPRDDLKPQLPRELWMWKNPWSFDVSDRELRRTEVLDHPSNEYIYILTTDQDDSTAKFVGTDPSSALSQKWNANQQVRGLVPDAAQGFVIKNLFNY